MISHRADHRLLLTASLAAALLAAPAVVSGDAAAAAKACPAGKVAQKKGKGPQARTVCVPALRDSVTLTVRPLSLRAGGNVTITAAGRAVKASRLAVVRRALVDQQGKRYSYRDCRGGDFAGLNGFREGYEDGLRVKNRFSVTRRSAQLGDYDLPQGATWQLCALLRTPAGRVIAVSAPRTVVVAPLA